jgi:hypothetical protein
MPRQGILATAVCAVALLVAAPVATASVRPPSMPGSTKGTKKCRNAHRFGATFRIYIVRGKHRITCKKARGLLQKTNPAQGQDPKGWTYWDWTKGGNRPWSDVWMRNDRKVIVGGIVLA